MRRGLLRWPAQLTSPACFSAANKKGAKWRALDIVRAVLLDKTRPPEARTSPGARYNWLFTGNPGTGKTTVARLFARLLTQLGLRGAAMRETLGVSLKHDGLKQLDTAIAALVAGGGGGGTLFIDEIHAVNPAAGGETRLIYERILDVAENRRTELSISA